MGIQGQLWLKNPRGVVSSWVVSEVQIQALGCRWKATLPTRRDRVVESVGCRLLDVVDDEEVYRAFGRFQFQAQLFLQGRENRCTVWIDDRRHLRSADSLLWQLIGHPAEIEVKGAVESSTVHHSSAHHAR